MHLETGGSSTLVYVRVFHVVLMKLFILEVISFYKINIYFKYFKCFEYFIILFILFLIWFWYDWPNEMKFNARISNCDFDYKSIYTCVDLFYENKSKIYLKNQNILDCLKHLK